MKYKISPKLGKDRIITEVKRADANGCLVLKAGAIVEIADAEMEYLVGNGILAKDLLLAIAPVAPTPPSGDEGDEASEDAEAKADSPAKAGDKSKAKAGNGSKKS